MRSAPSPHGPRPGSGLGSILPVVLLLAGSLVGACEPDRSGSAAATAAAAASPAPGPSPAPAAASPPAPDSPQTGAATTPTPLPPGPVPAAPRSDFDRFVSENAPLAAESAEIARGLDRQFLEPAIVSPDEAAAEIAAALADQDIEAVGRRDRALQLLGVLPAGQGLDEVYLALVPDQVIGFYLAAEDELYVVEPAEFTQTESDQALLTLAHEYVHALQQAHFDIESLSAAIPLLDLDRQLALSALIEGDASVFGFAAVAEQVDLAALQAAEPAPPPDLGRSGEFVLQLLAYPYVAGAEYVLGVLLGEGLSGLDRLYAPSGAPVATAAITPLGLRSGWEASVAAAFAAPELPCWEPLAVGSLGQFVLGALLGGRIERGQRGPGGWVDDHLLLIGNGATEVLMYRVEFAEPAAAEEFFGRLRRLIVSGRLDHAGRPGTIDASDPAGLAWRLEGRTALAALKGTGVSLVVGDHDPAATAAARALGREAMPDLDRSDYCPAQ